MTRKQQLINQLLNDFDKELPNQQTRRELHMRLLHFNEYELNLLASQLPQENANGTKQKVTQSTGQVHE